MNKCSEKLAEQNLLKLMITIQLKLPLKSNRHRNNSDFRIMHWSFDRSGLYSTPVLTIDNRFKYAQCDDYQAAASDDNIKLFKCIHGCSAWARLATKWEIVDGWENIVKYLVGVTPLEEHNCHNQLSQLQNLDSMMTCFNLN